MPRVPLWVHLVALAVLLLLSAFFSITETAMMAINRLRLRHLVRQGNAAARRTQTLLDRTDRLLSVLLIGNNLANTAATALVAALSIYDLGDQQWGLAAATVLIAFLILVFSEITPKIIGATYPEPIALAASCAASDPVDRDPRCMVRQLVRPADPARVAASTHTEYARDSSGHAGGIAYAGSGRFELHSGQAPQHAAQRL